MDARLTSVLQTCKLERVENGDSAKNRAKLHFMMHHFQSTATAAAGPNKLLTRLHY